MKKIKNADFMGFKGFLIAGDGLAEAIWKDLPAALSMTSSCFKVFYVNEAK